MATPYASTKRRRGGGRRGQQDPVDRVEQPHEADRDVADVDDAVVGEHRRMRARVGDEGRVVAQGLERGLRLDRPPEPILEVGADGGRAGGRRAAPDRPPPPSATVAAGHRAATTRRRDAVARTSDAGYGPLTRPVVSTTSRSEPLNRSSSWRTSSSKRGSLAPETYQGEPLSARIIP